MSRTGSADTEDAYRRDIERFLEYLRNRKITSFEDVTKEDMSSYITLLRSGEIDLHKLYGIPVENAVPEELGAKKEGGAAK